MSEKNESASDVPAENNSADFFAEPATASTSDSSGAQSAPAESSVTGSKSLRNSIPWAAVAAFSLVAAVGGFALGQTNGFDGRPAGAIERMGDGRMGDARHGNQEGRSGQDGFGGKSGRMHGDRMQDGQMHGGEIRGFTGNDGPMDGGTPHCHDANGQDVAVGTDGKCADGTVPMQRMDPYGHMGTATPGATATPSTSSSTLTN